jgi:apolipoprotein N-acyltransferase
MRACLIPCFALLAGVACAFSLSPYGLWPLMFFGLSLFYTIYAQSPSALRTCWHGFLFSLGYFTTGLWWIGNALLVDGNEFWWVWPLAVIGLPVLLSSFTAVFTGMAFSLSHPARLSGFLCFVGALSLSEWVRGHIFTGFPWNLYGYVWADHLSIAQMAAVAGSYGLTLLTLLWCAVPGYWLVASAPIRQKIIHVLGVSMTLLAALTYGHVRLAQNPTAMNDAVNIRIVQPNIGQDMKWDAAKAVAHFEKHLKLSAASRPTNKTTVIVWPETAIPSIFLRNPSARENIQRLLTDYPSPAYLISGILDRRQTDTGVLYYNGVAIFDAKGQMTPVYSKTHLVPFGEYIPFQKYIPIKPVVTFSGFEKGPGTTTVAPDGIPAFSPLVCYEIIFPAKAATDSPLRPLWIVNVTNDAWYGDSAGPYQHFIHSQFRAIEEGVPVIRSANTGISGMSDSFGRIIGKTQIFHDAVLTLPLPQPAPELTIFAKNGDFIFLILAIALIASAQICIKNRK